MTLTTEEKNLAITLKSQGLTKDEVKATISKNRVGFVPTNNKGLQRGETATDIKQWWEAQGKTVDKFIDKQTFRNNLLREQLTNKNNNILDKSTAGIEFGVSTGLSGITTALDSVFNTALGLGKLTTSQETEDNVSNFISDTATKLADNTPEIIKQKYDELKNKIESLKETDPETYQRLGIFKDTAEIGAGFVGGGQVSRSVNFTADKVSNAVNKAKDLSSTATNSALDRVKETTSNLKDIISDNTSEVKNNIKNKYNEKYNSLDEQELQSVKNLDRQTIDRYVNIADNTDIKGKTIQTQVVDDVVDELKKVEDKINNTGSEIGQIYDKFDNSIYDKNLVKSSISNVVNKFLTDKNLKIENGKIKSNEFGIKQNISTDDKKTLTTLFENAKRLRQVPNGKNLKIFLDFRKNIKYEDTQSNALGKSIATALKDIRNSKLNKEELKKFKTYTDYKKNLEELKLVDKSGNLKSSLVLRQQLFTTINQAGRTNTEKITPLSDFIKDITGKDIRDNANFGNLLRDVYDKNIDKSGFTSGVKKGIGEKDIPLSKSSAVLAGLEKLVGTGLNKAKSSVGIKVGVERFKEILDEIKPNL